MKLTIKNISGPIKWADSEHTAINLLVSFEEIGGDVAPYTSSPNDNADHCRELFDRCLSGEFGPIEDYQEEIISQSDFEFMIREQRNSLLAESDWTQLPDIPEHTRNKWSYYRQYLRDIPQQEGFPYDVEWPEKPV